MIFVRYELNKRKFLNKKPWTEFAKSLTKITSTLSTLLEQLSSLRQCSGSWEGMQTIFRSAEGQRNIIK
jgi:hypothetical protein